MRSPSLAFLALALVVGPALSAGCGSKASRDGFGDNPSAATDPTDPSGSSSGSSGFGGVAPKGVTIDPLNATVFIDTAAAPIVPGTQAFTVSNNGTDLTAGATFSLKDATLGTFSGATFTSLASLPAGTLGLSTYVTASTSAGDALGSLTVVALRRTGPSRDFFFSVPYEDVPAPKSDILAFSTNIKQADIAFSMDTTSSMSGSINNLKSALSGTLLPQLQAAIPNVGLAIVDFRDYGDDWVVKVRQAATTNLTLAQNAVAQMTAYGGGDTPEASISSMQFILDGKANTGSIPGHVSTTPGTYGGVDFRAGSVPIVINITDAEFHDPSGNATMTTLKAAFAATRAKYVAITDNGGPEDQANTLSDATGSSVPPSAFGSTCAAGKCCTGAGGVARAPTGPGGTCRLNFLSDRGNGVTSSVVKAVSAIAVGSTFDVRAVPSNDPKNAGGVDATKFISAIRAMDEGDAGNGCPASAAKDSDGDGIKDTFTAVQSGTPVCFEVIAAMNNTVPGTADPQFFNAFIDVLGAPGDIKLDTRSVLFLVPPTVTGVK